jgi:hypothetical protein|tara:strand:+ start:6362 stop:6631 length:270 start_codon:yes stop_codon:yes gene_type:complete
MRTVQVTPPTLAMIRLTPTQFHALEPNLYSPKKVDARARQYASTLSARTVAQPKPEIDLKTKPAESSRQQGLKKSVEQQHPTTLPEKVP